MPANAREKKGKKKEKNTHDDVVLFLYVCQGTTDNIIIVEGFLVRFYFTYHFVFDL